MAKRFLLGVLLTTALVFTGCSGEKEAPVNPTTGAGNAAPAAANITYGAGFHDQESGPGGSWRWMSEQGTIKLKNPKAEAHLKIAGNAPIDLIKKPAQITIKLNGEPLDQVTLTLEKNTLEKDYTVPASKLGTGDFVELTISSNAAFVPKEVYKNSSDDRKLSFSLRQLTWEAK